ncbi:hypothetical protein N665_0055s0016 [Sinapis alba]|nr:hypothetical protein N665_0055s0016 [Sinapis alba]
MTNTNRDELKSSNDSELPWMAKRSRSSTRRDSDAENKAKISSGPGKLVGQHVAGRVGRVPMKKRGNMVASPSPRMSSGRRGNSERSPKINHVSKLSPKNDSSGPDFSGIEILADAACNLSNDLAPAVDCLPAEEHVVEKQGVSTILPHAVDSTDQVVQGKNETVGGMVIATKGASESENLAPDSGVVIKSEKPSASEPTKKKNFRLHWDLNVSMDAWDPPCDVEDDASEKDVTGAMTKPMPPRENEPIDGSKDHLDGFVVSAGQERFSAPGVHKAEAAARNGNEFKSGYNSPLEDGELREPYRWRKNKVEDREIEPEDEEFYSMAESNDNKMKDSGKGISEETKLGPLKYKSHDALRIGEARDRRDIEKRSSSSSSSRRFVSKPFKELPSHDAIPRTRQVISLFNTSLLTPQWSFFVCFRYDDHEELSMDPYKFSGRHDRSSGRGYFSGSGSRPHYVFEPPHHDDLGMMGGFDQSGSGSGQGSQPNGYVGNRFSNGGYRGGRSFRRFSNGGDRVLRGSHGDNNQFSGRMHNWMSGNMRERGNSPVFRRSRSRSPVQWNGRDVLPPRHDGFRAEERMMERERFPFQKRFLEDQEIGFISPPRNRMPSPRFVERRSYDSGANHNSFMRERSFGLGQRYDAGSSLRRVNADNRNNYIPFRRQRTFDGVEESTGGNNFEMRQQQTRRADVTEDGGDDVRRFRVAGGKANNKNGDDNKEGSENKIT